MLQWVRDNELRAEGREEGREEGRQEGAITEAIKLYREEMKMEPREIVSKITCRFNLDPGTAETYVSDTLGIKNWC